MVCANFKQLLNKNSTNESIIQNYIPMLFYYIYHEKSI